MAIDLEKHSHYGATERNIGKGKTEPAEMALDTEA
jgi:hypothetical protein